MKNEDTCSGGLIHMKYFFFFFAQKTAYEIEYGLVDSEMYIKNRDQAKTIKQNKKNEKTKKLT